MVRLHSRRGPGARTAAGTMLAAALAVSGPVAAQVTEESGGSAGALAAPVQPEALPAFPMESFPDQAGAASPGLRGEAGLASPLQLQNSGPTLFDGSSLFAAPERVSSLPAEARSVRLVPSLGLQLYATDNINQTSTNRRSELVTALTPSVLASADTLTLRGVLRYTSVIQYFARASDESRIDHNLNLQGTATILPQTFFVDVRGSATTLSRSGGYSSNQAPVVSPDDRIQIFAGQISPYLVHRFDGIATASLGYAFQFGSQSGSSGTSRGQDRPFFQPQDYTGHQVYGVVRTGEDFGRLAVEARASSTSYQGSGILNNAHRSIGTVEARYAILPEFAALVELGYEDQEYSTAPKFSITGPIWTVGGRYAPGPGTIIIVKYGRRNGFDSAYLNAAIALGGRTTLYTTYAETLSTSVLRTQDLLSTTTLDALGNPVDRVTSAPVSYGESLLATQSGLFRMKRFDASVSQSWLRDVVRLSFNYLEQIPVAISPGTQSFAQRGPSISLAWGHDLTPRTQLSAYVQYGKTYSGGANGVGDVFTGQLGLRYDFTERLIGTALYRITRRSGYDPTDGSSLQNLVLVGLQMRL